MKSKSVFICQVCSYESLKWMGRCPNCGSWNSFLEEILEKSKNKDIIERNAVSIDKIEERENRRNRFKTGFDELDRLLGGGLVPGSFVLIGGDPGIGKSTLLLQVSFFISKNHKILYISGEESLEQIKLRADRLGIISNNMYILSETNLDVITNCMDQLKAEVVIIDSIQTISGSNSLPGSISQIRDAAYALMNYAKTKGVTIIIVGHITKDGFIAGPKLLEHMVDVVLYFEGNSNLLYRILRSTKNRFGASNEVAIFEMREEGLREVLNPSQLFIEGRTKNVPGSVVSCAVEGSKAILVEVQALCCDTSLAVPRRVVTGVDYNRVSILTAVLEKRFGLNLQHQDIYVNLVGGLKINEPALDLAIVAAIASSYRNIEVMDRSVIIGEVGLTGEVRPVSHIEKRISEAFRMGFETCIIPKSNLKDIKQKDYNRILTAENLYSVLDVILGG